MSRLSRPRLRCTVPGWDGLGVLVWGLWVGLGDCLGGVKVAWGDSSKRARLLTLCCNRADVSCSLYVGES